MHRFRHCVCQPVSCIHLIQTWDITHPRRSASKAITPLYCGDRIASRCSFPSHIVPTQPASFYGCLHRERTLPDSTSPTATFAGRQRRFFPPLRLLLCREHRLPNENRRKRGMRPQPVHDLPVIGSYNMFVCWRLW